jgi:Raf kinase inhibitor-like YbhB/YbcL family protein
MILLYLFAAIPFFNLSMPDVSSPAFQKNEMIPKKYSCLGENISPALHISGLPPNTVTVAIILQDPDAPMKGGFTHWVAWNITPGGDLPEKFSDGEQGLNGAKQKGYTGPCPPSGIHHYHFMVYALDTKLMIDPKPGKAELEKAIQDHILAQGELIGLISK